MGEMTRLEALISLNMVGDIGSVRLKKLLDYFAKPQDILKAPVEKLMSAGIGERIAQRIPALKKEELNKEFKSAQKLGLEILTYEDSDYPENLKNIPGAPIVLYVKGKFAPQDKYSIGIVGSRRASFYGLTSAEKFSAELSTLGFTIVSGMARGIDTASHKGALKMRGRTIAVMGSGFDHIYPVENKELSEEIAQNGAVISEFPLDTQPFKQNFPRRNRVISGLSLGVLVVEAAQNSGALITADFALEQGREVFALPGKVDSRTAFGTNGLIKQGAKLVSHVQDIIEELEAPIKNKSKGTRTLNEQKTHSEDFLPAPKNLAGKELALYNIISAQPIGLDDIADKLNLDIPKIADLLLRLQMRRLIKELPGKQFIKYQDLKI
jgi:DNA processing protein